MKYQLHNIKQKAKCGSTTMYFLSYRETPIGTVHAGWWQKMLFPRDMQARKIGPELQSVILLVACFLTAVC